MTRPAFAAAVLACAASLPQSAHAHLVSTRFGDFYDGMLHPVTSFEHMVPWLALGLLAGAQPGAGRWVLLTFPIGLAAGVFLGVVMPGVSAVTTVNLISILVLGGLVALALPLPPLLIALLACAVGVSHGYANGTAMTDATNPALFTPGVVMSGYLVILMLAAFAAIASEQSYAGRIALRALGSWIFAIGLMMLGTALA